MEAVGEAESMVATLQAAGIRRRSLGVVDLRSTTGVERDPLARWALSRIGRETTSAVVLSLPGLVWVGIALFMLGIPNQTTRALALGVVAGLSASPVTALVGFALAWDRWGHLANGDQDALPASGYLVVAARGQGPELPECSAADDEQQMRGLDGDVERVEVMAVAGVVTAALDEDTSDAARGTAETGARRRPVIATSERIRLVSMRDLSSVAPPSTAQSRGGT